MEIKAEEPKTYAVYFSNSLYRELLSIQTRPVLRIVFKDKEISEEDLLFLLNEADA